MLNGPTAWNNQLILMAVCCRWPSDLGNSVEHGVQNQYLCLPKTRPLLTLITPAVVPKRHTLSEIIFWNNCAWLNMCRACWTLWGAMGLTVLKLISIRMEQPRPLQVCTNVCIIFAHTVAWVIRVGFAPVWRENWKLEFKIYFTLFFTRALFVKNGTNTG